MQGSGSEGMGAVATGGWGDRDPRSGALETAPGSLAGRAEPACPLPPWPSPSGGKGAPPATAIDSLPTAGVEKLGGTQGQTYSGQHRGGPGTVFSKQASRVIPMQVTEGPHLEKHLARSAVATLSEQHFPQVTHYSWHCCVNMQPNESTETTASWPRRDSDPCRSTPGGWQHRVNTGFWGFENTGAGSGVGDKKLGVSPTALRIKVGPQNTTNPSHTIHKSWKVETAH